MFKRKKAQEVTSLTVSRKKRKMSVESRRVKFFFIYLCECSDGGTVNKCRDDFNVSFSSKLFHDY